MSHRSSLVWTLIVETFFETELFFHLQLPQIQKLSSIRPFFSGSIQSRCLLPELELEAKQDFGLAKKNQM